MFSIDDIVARLDLLSPVVGDLLQVSKMIACACAVQVGISLWRCVQAGRNSKDC